MTLTKLEIFRLRNIEHAAVNPGPHLNLLIGENGSGKTSGLEAIHLLSRARSLRTAHLSQLIQFGETDALVTGVVLSEGRGTRLGVRVSRQHREMHIDGQALLARADLLRTFPVQVIQPSSILLLEGSPRVRRQFLDWGTFHVEHTYLDDWRRFAKALNQRNAVLKCWRPSDIEPWNHEVARYGTIVAEARKRYLDRLTPHLEDTLRAFFGGSAAIVACLPGWKEGRLLLDVLQEDAAEDIRLGYTRSGPHRGDFVVTINGSPAKTYLSRGQTKLLVYALLLAQTSLLAADGCSVCVLIDDLASELDRRNRARLLELLLRRRAQCFITAVHPDDLQCPSAEDTMMFHVEHGRISEGSWNLS
jgi:DNA replication and repair protein RecF